MNGDLPPEVWAEREVAATLNLNDLGSESRAVELVVQPLAPTLQAGGNDTGGTRPPGTTVDTAESLIVTVTGDRTHALTSEGADASEGGTGRGTPIIFAHVNGMDAQPSPTTSPTLRAGHDTMPSVAYTASREVAQSLTANYGKQPDNSDTNLGPTLATGGTTVRRLTPRECERLQGFPDDWTLTSNGKPQADSARYRQMGNAVAVPVFEWVVRRIVESEAS